MQAGLEIQLIAVFISAACALPGVFLVLRKMSMMSDSITHTILLGIVLAFFITHDLSSPLLIIGAGAMGVITVWLTEMLGKTKLVSEDSAIGIIFPLLFSIAIILITKHAGSVHLDTDSVLLGELAFAPFDRMIVGGMDIGAKGIYTAGALLAVNIAAISFFYKELKLSTFDTVLASVLGFSPALLHYGLMTLVSLTAVGAFEAVGSVLVVAFMIGPPITAYLLTDNLKYMLLLSAAFAALGAVMGYQAASILDVSIAGCMAVAVGAIFLMIFVFAPKRGLVTTLLRKIRQKKTFLQNILLLHIYHHQDRRDACDELGMDTIHMHLRWNAKLSAALIRQLERERYVRLGSGGYRLTGTGLDRCRAFEQVLGC